MNRTWLGAAVAAALAVPSVAQACGGFFCNANTPVDQAAEEILFAVDEEGDTVTMHVSIQYAGPAEEFAWIVPVPGEPQLAIGTDALFPVLSRLRAQFQLNRDVSPCGALPVFTASASGSPDAGGGVRVVSSGVVGPYETVVLQAKDSTELLDWLQSHDFDLPDGLDPLLAPYVAEGQHFVALRLAKDKDAGDLEPLVMTYPGTAIGIPIQLTSVAATPDMGLRVYVLGEHRAVPDSYLHVVLNELAIDWWTGGQNLDSVITRAADEAGGHGFFTDYAGDAALVQGALYRAGWDPVVADLAVTTGASDTLWRVLQYGLPLDDALLGVLSDHLGLPDVTTDDLDLLDIFGCLSPYSYYGYYASGDPEECFAAELAEIVFDPAALAADVETVFLEPRRRTDALLASHPKITRLTSSVSPVEMTVDPTFVFNPSLPDVDPVHTATETFLCEEEGNLSDAPRRLTLSDGRSVMLPSANDLAQAGKTEIQWLEDHALTEPATAWIERTGATGDPEVLTDNRDFLWSQLDDSIAGVQGGCGCSPARSAGGGTAALLIAALLAARRRQTG